MPLYNCKTEIDRDGKDWWRITKFDRDHNVESTYRCTASECECPAGVRPMCRHREMLPRFINRGAINTGWMFDYDRGGWVDMRSSDEYIADCLPEPHSTTASVPDFESEDTGSNPVGAANLPRKKPNDGRRV